MDDPKEKELFFKEIQDAFRHFKDSGYDIEINGVYEIVGGGSCNYYKQLYDIDLIKYSFDERHSGRPQLCATENHILSNICEAMNSELSPSGRL